jgi:hypothetical protein
MRRNQGHVEKLIEKPSRSWISSSNSWTSREALSPAARWRRRYIPGGRPWPAAQHANDTIPMLRSLPKQFFN